MHSAHTCSGTWIHNFALYLDLTRVRGVFWASAHWHASHLPKHCDICIYVCVEGFGGWGIKIRELNRQKAAILIVKGQSSHFSDDVHGTWLLKLMFLWTVGWKLLNLSQWGCWCQVFIVDSVKCKHPVSFRVDLYNQP